MYREAVIHGYENEIDERQHREDGDEYAVIDDRRVAIEGIINDVSGNRENEECPKELQ